MKIKGKKIEGPNEQILVIPRQNDDIVFKARAVLDIDEFEKICPPPKPPMMLRKGGKKVPDFEHPVFKGQSTAWAEKQTNWLVLKSLEATEGLEWETVNLSDPDTWGNWEEELKQAGFTNIEVQRITLLVMDVNSLNEARLEEARERFLNEQMQAQEKSSSQKEEVLSSQSGEPASE